MTGSGKTPLVVVHDAGDVGYRLQGGALPAVLVEDRDQEGTVPGKNNAYVVPLVVKGPHFVSHRYSGGQVLGQSTGIKRNVPCTDILPRVNPRDSTGTVVGFLIRRSSHRFRKPA